MKQHTKAYQDLVDLVDLVVDVLVAGAGSWTEGARGLLEAQGAPAVGHQQHQQPVFPLCSPQFPQI